MSLMLTFAFHTKENQGIDSIDSYLKLVIGCTLVIY